MLLAKIKNPAYRQVIAVAIAFFVLTLTLTLHRYYAFYASYDQGIFNQVFWNGIHGRFFESSLSSQLSTNVVHNNEVTSVYYHRLGQHFTPALLLWIPLYALFPSPATLTVLQVTLVTLAGLVLYVICQHYNIKQAIAIAIVTSFYGANAVLGPTLSNFHDICQIPLYTFGLLLAMEKRWWWLFSILAIFILAVREDAGVGLFGVGIYMVTSKRFPRIGLAVSALSFLYMILLTNTIMPLFSADISQRFMIERFGQYADGEEASTLEIIWGMVKNPFRLFIELFSPFFGTIKYLVAQWLPLAFIPIASPAAWTIAGFPLLKLFLGQGESVLSINIRYAMTVVPGLFYGAVIWWSQHPELFKKLSFRRFWIGCICISLILTITSNPNRTLSFLVPDSFNPWVYVSLPRQWQHASHIQNLIDRIPPNASLAATTYIVPHVSSRREIIRFPALQLRNDAREVIDVDFAIADLWQLQQYQVAFKTDRQILKDCIYAIDLIFSNQLYGIVGFEDGVILMQKKATSNPDAILAWQKFRQEIEVILNK